MAQILVNNLCFAFPASEPIFKNLTLAFSPHKIGLVGRNGIGKSTLLRLLLGELSPSSGLIQGQAKLAYLPQTPVFAEGATVAAFLGYAEKIQAWQRICQGSLAEADFLALQEDWDVVARIQAALLKFGLPQLPYARPMAALSGGEITRLFLAKAFLAEVDFLLLDEPTNHLDQAARQLLYQSIWQWQGGMIVISHDRELLNLMAEIIELTALGAACYGGNYAHYVLQKQIEEDAKMQQWHDAKKLMHNTRRMIQISREKHQQKQAYGKKLKKSGSIDKMAANAKKGRSEKTQSQLVIKAQRLREQAETQLKFAAEQIELVDNIVVDLPMTYVPKGKLILNIEKLDFAYCAEQPLLRNFNLTLRGPERISLRGDNGSGKTTLIKLILQQLKPQSGQIYLGVERIGYIDQMASLLDPQLSILENFLRLNPEVTANTAYHRLAQFMFKNVAALQLVKTLSGGEKLRALLACVLMSSQPPQLLILDEPTNHLDLPAIASIETVLNCYQGAMLVVSHDQTFGQNINAVKAIAVP